MAREEDGLKRRIADLDAERPALAALYSSLSAGQRGILFHPAALMSGGPMMGRHFGAGDHGGPADRPSPPSPQ
jgi:hypothetical protein